MTIMYVCEWAFIDIEISEEIKLMQTYDYTYSPQLQAAQTLCSMEKNGYIIAKGLDPEDELVLKKIPKKLESLCIWVYTEGELSSKYDYYNDAWHHLEKNETWDEEWKDMLVIPFPLQDFS